MPQEPIDDDDREDPVETTQKVDCEMCGGSGEGYRPGGPLCRHCRGTGEREIER